MEEKKHMPAEPIVTHVPPGPSVPKALLGVAFMANRRRTLQLLRRRYGSAFSINLPIYGRAVVVSDPILVKQLYMSSQDDVGNVQPNLGQILGPGSFFSLEGASHKRQRKLLVPPFNGKRMQTYESIVEDEAIREAASWPIGEEFETLPSMMRVTLNAILRAVFGAEGAEFEQLRVILPPMVELGSKLMAVPILRAQHLGRWSPWGRYTAYRREFDAAITTLIAKHLADPALGERTDVLSLMLLARYDDGEPMTHSDIADQLLTVLAAGHETTATTLAWIVERLSRHPVLLERLVRESDEGGDELRRATILETQRCRSVIDLTARKVKATTLELGEWTIPNGSTVLVGMNLVHADDAVFADAARFEPDRFVGVHPDTYSWVPFGGGTRRCIGAAFADMEMNVVLATLLHSFDLQPTSAPAERWRSRGIAYAPAKGGRAVVRRRQPSPRGGEIVSSLTRAS
jgi:cytochrome P450